MGVPIHPHISAGPNQVRNLSYLPYLDVDFYFQVDSFPHHPDRAGGSAAFGGALYAVASTFDVCPPQSAREN